MDRGIFCFECRSAGLSAFCFNSVPRYLTCEGETKKKTMEILHLLYVVRLKTALLAPVNPNRAWLITYMYHNVENA